MSPDEIAVEMEKYLNSAFTADPGAIHALMCNRVPCNNELTEHPHVIVERIPVLTSEHNVVGLLGMLNGFLTTVGAPKVAARWQHVEDQHTLLGFEVIPPTG